VRTARRPIPYGTTQLNINGDSMQEQDNQEERKIVPVELVPIDGGVGLMLTGEHVMEFHKVWNAMILKAKIEGIEELINSCNTTGKNVLANAIQDHIDSQKPVEH
jgi:hypothetical protein